MKKIIIANWKMNMQNKDGIQFAKNLKKSKSTVLIAAPFTMLPSLSVINGNFALSSQNVSTMDQGAYTGEISAKMLKNLGVKYCIVGHSERRIYFKEDDTQINLKIKRLLENKITPILCFGETYEEKKAKKTFHIITKQIKNGLKGVDVSKVILAYEPVWAISSFQKGNKKLSATVNEIEEINSFIKKLLLKEYKEKGRFVPILYGGSVNEKNSVNLLNIKNVDGLLVGSASLNIKSFNTIINYV